MKDISPSTDEPEDRDPYSPSLVRFSEDSQTTRFLSSTLQEKSIQPQSTLKNSLSTKISSIKTICKLPCH
jgi:hypothetical protein